MIVNQLVDHSIILQRFINQVPTVVYNVANGNKINHLLLVSSAIVLHEGPEQAEGGCSLFDFDHACI